MALTLSLVLMVGLLLMVAGGRGVLTALRDHREKA
jgi:hypothetical protein